jgi:hypothetical protein
VPTTPKQGAPYPGSGDSPHGPNQFLAQAQWTQDRIIQRYASVADRSTRNPAPGDGEVTYLEDTDELELRRAGTWTRLPRAGALTTGATGASATLTLGTAAEVISGTDITVQAVAGVPFLVIAFFDFDCTGYTSGTTAAVGELQYGPAGGLATAPGQATFTAKSVGERTTAGQTWTVVPSVNGSYILRLVAHQNGTGAAYAANATHTRISYTRLGI